MTTSIFIGDPHFQVGNIPEVDLFLEKITKLAQERKPDFIVIGGDLLHTHERLHTTALNKAYELVDRMRKISYTYVLVGNHDMCLGKDVPVLLWKGGTKLSQNIKKGDILIGDDGSKRIVETTCNGISDLYLIKQQKAEDYIVNGNHILSLKLGYHKSMFWNTTKNCWTVKWIDKLSMKLKSKMFPLKTRGETYDSYVLFTKEQAKNRAQNFLDRIDDILVTDISVTDFLKVPKNVRERMYGYRTSGVDWPKKDVEIDPYILGLWIGDGNKDGTGFSGSDIQLINKWQQWVWENDGEIVHTGQYNFHIRRAGYKANNRISIDNPKMGTKNCKACVSHINNYNRAPSLSCASVEELHSIINDNNTTISYFSKNASTGQLESMNKDLIRERIGYKKSPHIKSEMTKHTNPLKDKLKKYGLINNKHIPIDYMTNDTDTRLKLLAGIVDTDGSVADDGRTITITQGGKNIHIIDQIAYISRSLGFSTHIGSLLTNKDEQSYRTITISGNVERIPCILSRKKCIPKKLMDSRDRKCADKLRTKISVEPLGQGEYYGFSVNGNNRFLLGDYTVTHNCNNQQFLTTNHWMNGMKEWENVTIVDKVICNYINNEKFVFVPYVPPGRFQEALETLSEPWSDASCIFAHQEFAGCKMGAIVSVEGDKWPEDYPEVISGHIHSRQFPQQNIYYTGAAMQHAFGESEKNIIACLTFNVDGTYDKDEVDLCLPRKKIVYKDVKELEDYVPPETEDKVKVTVSGEYEEFKALKKTKKYKNLVKEGVKVVFKPKKLELKEKTEKRKELEGNTDFKGILNTIVNNQADPYLTQAFELVLNGKETKVDDVIFLS